MQTFEAVSPLQFVLFALGAVFGLGMPIAAAIWWTKKTKQPLSSVLIGAAVFFVFALMLEKPLQNLLVFPTQMGLSKHAVSRFLAARPIAFTLVLGLFPGIFEETGRFVAFKTLLKDRRERQTAISCGIGHGGLEILLVFGLTYINNLAYAAMANSGALAVTIDELAKTAPEQAQALSGVAAQLSAFSAQELCLGIAERIFSFLFHLGASILVFFAARDRRRFWLFPLAVVLHTALDFTAGLYAAGILAVPLWALEGIIALFGALTFFGAYFLLYRKDR